MLLEHPEAARLGGQRCRITVLFSDIRSYTTLSEKLSPEAVVEWLNEYFGAQVAVIFRHRGTVDKFIGDAVMAFWGAPLPEPEQERLAALCAAEMVATARRMAEDWQRRGGPPLAIGVGIATGDAVVGNVGSHQLRSYTAIGDTVNLASRLEGKTKGLEVRKLAEITVKGRAAAVRVYTFAEN
jgi:adenylate cyclase